MLLPVRFCTVLHVGKTCIGFKANNALIGGLNKLYHWSTGLQHLAPAVSYQHLCIRCEQVTHVNKQSIQVTSKARFPGTSSKLLSVAVTRNHSTAGCKMQFKRPLTLCCLLSAVVAASVVSRPISDS